MKGTGNVDFPRGKKNAKMFYCVDGWVDGWMDGWMGGWVDGWMGGWMGGW